MTDSEQSHWIYQGFKGFIKSDFCFLYQCLSLNLNSWKLSDCVVFQYWHHLVTFSGSDKNNFCCKNQLGTMAITWTWNLKITNHNASVRVLSCQCKSFNCPKPIEEFSWRISHTKEHLNMEGNFSFFVLIIMQCQRSCCLIFSFSHDLNYHI